MSKLKRVKKIALTVVSVLTIGVSGTVLVKYGVPYIKQKLKKRKDNKEKTNNDTK